MFLEKLGTVVCSYLKNSNKGAAVEDYFQQRIIPHVFLQCTFPSTRRPTIYEIVNYSTL